MTVPTKSIAFAVFLLAGAPGAALAQNAEETAAFLLFGLEDMETPGAEGLMRVTQTSKSPAEYVVDLAGRTGTIKVAQISDEKCRFTAERITAGGEAPVRTNFSFERATLVDETPPSGAPRLVFAGLQCRALDETTRLLTKPCAPDAVTPPYGDATRLRRAFDFFRSSFCRPMAF